MFLRILSLLLILFSINIQARPLPIEIIEYLDNTTVVAFIDKSDINKTSHWNPAKDSLPLSIEGALKAIRKHIAPDPKLNKATLIEIELKQIPNHEGYWHYLVKMNTRDKGKLHRHYLVVLLTGKVILGIREPETIK